MYGRVRRRRFVNFRVALHHAVSGDANPHVYRILVKNSVIGPGVNGLIDFSGARTRATIHAAEKS